MKVKDDIILNPRAHSFQAGEQLHARSVHSIFLKHQLKCKMGPLAIKGNKKRHKLGDKLRSKGDKALGRRTHHPTKVNKKEDKRGDKMGDKLETRETRPWEGGRTIQQRETRRERNWETRGKADTPSNKGNQDGRQAGRQDGRQGGHTIQ